MSVDKASRAARAEGILLMGKKFQELKLKREQQAQPSGTNVFMFFNESYGLAPVRLFYRRENFQNLMCGGTDGASGHFLFTDDAAPRRSPRDKPVDPDEFKKHIQDTFLSAYQHRQNHSG